MIFYDSCILGVMSYPVVKQVDLIDKDRGLTHHKRTGIYISLTLVNRSLRVESSCIDYANDTR